MAWPRRQKRAPVALFHAAFAAIDKMEVAVVYRTVTCDFTTRDVANWLWPAEVVEALTRVFPYANERYTFRDHHDESITLREDFDICFKLHLAPLRMASPDDGHCALQLDTYPAIWRVLAELGTIHKQYNKVRACVAWMNENATLGAAKFYFPSLGCLLPANHAFHNTDGQRYKEPAVNMSGINVLLREVGAIVTSGLLADPDHVEITAKAFGVKVNGTSQMFMLI